MTLKSLVTFRILYFHCRLLLLLLMSPIALLLSLLSFVFGTWFDASASVTVAVDVPVCSSAADANSYTHTHIATIAESAPMSMCISRLWSRRLRRRFEGYTHSAIHTYVHTHTHALSRNPIEIFSDNFVLLSFALFICLRGVPRATKEFQMRDQNQQQRQKLRSLPNAAD